MSGTEKRIGQFEPYVVAWCDKMVEIWRDRIDLLGASPHGNLRASVKAGPRVIEQTVREKLPEGFQRAEMLLEKGAVDMIVDRRDMREVVSELLALLCDKPTPSI